jgi:geranylgeranyl pyrophosphate synthase
MPRSVSTYAELEAMGNQMYRPINTDIPIVNKGMLDPFYNLIDCGGKRWRPVYGMILASDYGVDISDFEKNQDLYHLLAIGEIIHNASLIIDDIEDKSLMRRGQPCAYIKYGQDVAINMGCHAMTYVSTDFMLNFKAKTPELKIKLITEICKEISCLHFGQNWDICWHNNMSFPDQDAYFQMTSSKTGVIPRLIATTVNMLYGADDKKIKDIQNMTNDLGIAFQIHDDVIALESDLYAETRGIVGEDIHEGKRTLMVIHSFKNLPKEKGKRLIDILNMQTEDKEIIKEAIDLIKSTSSIDYAKEVAHSLMNK